MTKKQVGQIIYVLLNSEMSLTPVLIVEEVVRRTLTGEETNYFVEAVGNTGAKKKFQLDANKCKVFDEIEQAKEYLSSNALDAIASLCLTAQRKAAALLESNENKNNRENFEESSVQEYETVLLEDGTRVKINLKG